MSPGASVRSSYSFPPERHTFAAGAVSHGGRPFATRIVCDDAVMFVMKLYVEYSTPFRTVSGCENVMLKRGSWITITILCLLASMMFSAIGILVGSRARTIEGVSGLMNLIIMPMWVVSGVFFSAQRFPDVVQPIIKALPLTLLLDSLRAVQLQGVSITAVWFEIAVMTFWLVTAFTAALKLFRWK